MTGDRYARQRLIKGWDQDRLGEARVLVAGAGALGNELSKNLALLGVGHLLLIDHDRIEASNLSRAPLFCARDVGRKKVEAAAESLARLNPEVEVRTINGDVASDLGLGWYRHSSLAIGCLDNLAARSQVGLACTLAGTPFLDGAMWSLGGEVRWFTAGDGPCFDCTMTAEDWGRANQRWSCTGLRGQDQADQEEVGSLVSTAAIIGGLLAQEAVKYLCGQPIDGGRILVYNGEALTLHRAELERASNCRSRHECYEQVVELPLAAHDTSVAQLLQRVRADLVTTSAEQPFLDLGRDYLVSLHCPTCQVTEQVGLVAGAVAEQRRPCPSCAKPRQTEVVVSVDDQSPLAQHPLASLGIPPGEVLALRAGEQLRLYELTGDVWSGNPIAQTQVESQEEA